VAVSKRFCAACGQSMILLATTDEPAPTILSCAKCGVAISLGKRFCTRCGQPIDTAIPSVLTESSPIGQAESVETAKLAVEISLGVIPAEQDEMPAPNSHSKRNTVGAIVMASIVMVAACGFLAWNVHRQRDIASRISESKQQVQEAVSLWADAFRSKNSTALAASYAATVEKYFRRDNVSRDQIHGYFQSAFARIKYIQTYEIDDIKVELLPVVNGPDDRVIPSRAAATFHKTWDTRQFDGKTSSGEEIERLTFASSPVGWKIVREEELNVIKASRH
jgi:ribosomal protein S27AE